MKRTMSFMLLLALVIAAMTFPANVKQAQGQEKIVLEQWYHQYGEEGTYEAVLRYAEEYMALHPNIQINITWIPSDYTGRLEAAMAAGEGPDVFETQATLDRIRAGWFAPLNDLFTEDVLADFSPEVIRQVSYDGTIYGIPMVIDTGVIFYRKSMLEEAGVEPPTTMDELIAAAQALDTGRVKGLYIGNDGGLHIDFARFLLWSAGSEFIADGEQGFNNERTVLAFSKMKELHETDALLIGAPTEWWDPSVFIDGLAAMQFCGLWALPTIEAALGDDFGVVPWPALDDQGVPSTWVGGWKEFVNADSKYLEEAKAYAQWLWIENLEVQKDFNLAYGFHIPPRLSVAQEAEQLKSGPAAEIVEIAAMYGKPQGDPFRTGPMQEALATALFNIVQENADPAEEVARAAEIVEQELAIVLGD